MEIRFESATLIRTTSMHSTNSSHIEGPKQIWRFEFAIVVRGSHSYLKYPLSELALDVVKKLLLPYVIRQLWNVHRTRRCHASVNLLDQ